MTARATKREQTWETLAFTWFPQSMLVRLGIQPTQRRCPACHSIIYSRRHSLCGACGNALPEQCRFTDQEARIVEKLLEAERARHRAWLKRTACA